MRYPQLRTCIDEIARASELLHVVFARGNKLLVCGNGGSAADADHIVGELAKSFVRKRPVDRDLALRLREADPEKGELLADSLQQGLTALSLTGQPSLSTAFGNDVNPYMVYAQQTLVYGAQDDMYWGISTSGNAANVVYGAITAKAKRMKVLGMTGMDGGELKRLSDVCICVPQSTTFLVQELHLPIYHAICMYLEQLFW